MERTTRRRTSISLLTISVLLVSAVPTFAGFASTETYLPAVGRVPGKNGAQFYTTVWATNLTSAPQTFTFEFLKTGQSNPSPASFHDSLAPGQTKVYENVVESKLGLTNALGAARILSSGEIFVSERIYNQNPGDDLGNTEGLFFAGVPKTFSISSGESASIQGIDEGSSENFRYNFALIETGGGNPTVNVQVFDGSGTMLGQKSYPLLPYEHVQPSVDDVVPGIATTNARITATVTGGSGSVLLAGAQVANESQDSSGFEMTFRDDLLGGGGGGGTAGVTSLNGLTGALTLKAGSGISITHSGSQISIASTGGAGGSLTLPFSGSSNTTQTTFSVSNTGGGGAIEADANLAGYIASQNPFALKAVNSGNGTAIYGATNGASGQQGVAGVWGDSHDVTAVYGTSVNDVGVRGVSSSGTAGVYGTAGNGDGVLGQVNSAAHAGVSGTNTGAGFGVYGGGGTGWGVFGIINGGNAATGGVNQSAGGVGVLGRVENGSGLDASGGSGVWGDSYLVGVYGTGKYGIAGGSSGGGGFAVYAQGSFGGTGAKYFVEPHPTDPTKEIRYVCLEGRESGTYFRGTGHIVGGFATIEVPEDFRIVTSSRGLTVVVTPIGEMASLAVIRRGLDRIVVQGSRDVEFDYVVNGVRKAFEDLQPVSENTNFVPRWPNDPHLTGGLPPESRRRLIESGILNADGTTNLETAHRLGWDLQKSWKRAQDEAKR
ncbi:MAG TPA: hypothetical protein VG777_04315 [Thermoanaerobaculia bacterium]|nr:hypothetical protein [Thermoanaerobaculia bacterium]